jgi:hypothetical protein
MPVLECPHCRKQVRVPESAAGRRARCPLCQEAFSVPAEDEAVTEDRPPPRSRHPRDEDDRPRRFRDEEDDRPRRRPREDEEDYRPRRSRSDDNPFSNLDDRRRRSRPRYERSGGDWRWGWSPFIGITYGPIPVGMLIGVFMLLVGGCAGVLSHVR